MSTKEILEMTASGGIYCVIPREKPLAPIYDCARPNGYAVRELLEEIRRGNNSENSDIKSFATDGDILRWAIARLSQSPAARAFIHDARFDDWMIVLETAEKEFAQTDHHLKVITISRHADSIAVFARSHVAQMQVLFDLTKAFRQVWQAGNMRLKPEKMNAVNYILFSRLSEADADLCAIFCAYQMRERGDHDMWRHILSSDLQPMAASLGECLDFDASTDGILDTMGFIFQDWFEDEQRLARVDHAALNELDAIAETEIGAQEIGFEDVLQLSILPDGFSYLEYVAADILNEEFYREITDPTNRVHFAQIAKETNIDLRAGALFHDTDLARRIFPQVTFETVV